MVSKDGTKVRPRIGVAAEDAGRAADAGAAPVGALRRGLHKKSVLWVECEAAGGIYQPFPVIRVGPEMSSAVSSD